jgi:pimeloyl-ACP methyl ester carboxylesterase
MFKLPIVGPTSHYFYSQRLKLHYVDWGNADKPLMVLVHGGRDHARNWDQVALHLRS